MRILFTFVGGDGHFEPLVAFARALVAARHTVAFGCHPAMAARVRAAGFEVFAIGEGGRREPPRLPLRAVDRGREESELRERFARRAARYRAPLTLELSRRWRPDVVVCDETDFGAMVAAEVQDIPHATVLVIAAGGFVRAEVVGEALAPLRAEHRLPPDPDFAMPSRHLVLSPFPPRFRDPAHPLPATAHSFQPAAAGSAHAHAPVWAASRPRRPTVYFTLGTVFNTESGDLLGRVTGALAELPIDLVVTVGSAIDPAELGPQPAHVHVARFVPQASLLPHCDGVVCHAGSGSVMGALAHGLPMVLMPLGADQPSNADRCAALGVARVLDATTVTPEQIRAEVSDLLVDDRRRANAEGLRDEIARLPPAADAVVLVEALARGAAPAPRR